jgi:hypothetical protein
MAAPPTPNASTLVPTLTPTVSTAFPTSSPNYTASPTLTPTISPSPTFSPTIQAVEFDAIATALLVASLGSPPSLPNKNARVIIS